MSRFVVFSILFFCFFVSSLFGGVTPPISPYKDPSERPTVAAYVGVGPVERDLFGCRGASSTGEMLDQPPYDRGEEQKFLDINPPPPKAPAAQCSRSDCRSRSGALSHPRDRDNSKSYLFYSRQGWVLQLSFDMEAALLRDYGVSLSTIRIFELLETGMFRDTKLQGEGVDVLDIYTPERLRGIEREICEEAGFDIDDEDDYESCQEVSAEFFSRLRLGLRSLKSDFPEKVVESKAQQLSGGALTPPARYAAQNMAESSHFSRALKELLQGLFYPVLLEMFREEKEEAVSEEERSARRAHIRSVAEKIAKKPESEKALASVSEAWVGHLKYLQGRVDEIRGGAEAKKITGSEIEDAFVEWVSPYYRSFKIQVECVGECQVFFNPEEIDLSRLNHEGETSLQLMKRGCAPIGPDGLPMNLHHLTRRQPGILVFLPESFHQESTLLLHLRDRRLMRQPAPINRNEFSVVKAGAVSELLNFLEAKNKQATGVNDD